MFILVVEDDVLIRMILVEELTEAGFDVAEAADGDEAVGILDKADPFPAIVVTDVHMPGSRSGIEVAAFVRDRRPDVPVIFTTGRPDALLGLGVLDGRQSLIRKPYVPGEIVSRIRELTLAR